MPPEPSLNNRPPKLLRSILCIRSNVIEVEFKTCACSEGVFGEALDLLDHVHQMSKHRLVSRDIPVQLVSQEIIAGVSQQSFPVRIFPCKAIEALLQPFYRAAGDPNIPTSPLLAMLFARLLDESLANFISFKPLANDHE